MRDVDEPQDEDFSVVEAAIQRHRDVYDDQYRKIRNRVVAHRVVSNDEQVHDLFKRTNLTELEQLIEFLLEVHEAFWQLFTNGRSLTLRPKRYSVPTIVRQAICGLPPKAGLAERIGHEAVEVLRCLAGKKKWNRRSTKHTG